MKRNFLKVFTLSCFVFFSYSCHLSAMSLGDEYVQLLKQVSPIGENVTDLQSSFTDLYLSALDQDASFQKMVEKKTKSEVNSLKTEMVSKYLESQFLDDFYTLIAEVCRESISLNELQEYAALVTSPAYKLVNEKMEKLKNGESSEVKSFAEALEKISNGEVIPTQKNLDCSSSYKVLFDQYYPGSTWEGIYKMLTYGNLSVNADNEKNYRIQVLNLLIPNINEEELKLLCAVQRSTVEKKLKEKSVGLLQMVLTLQAHEKLLQAFLDWVHKTEI